MKIIGAISWFNESPAWLARSIVSLAQVCDQIVAVDGRYALFQHDMDWSPAPEAEAVLAVAEGVGVPLTLHIPRAPFYGNEVEKRNLVMKLAMVHAEPMVDWVLVIDGDEYVVRAAPDLHEIVSNVKEYAMNFALEEYIEPYAELGGGDGGVALRSSFPTTWRVNIRGVYRALPGLSYVGNHHSIGGWVDDKWVWVWGMLGDQCEAFDLRDFLVIRHENPRRVALRREQAATYYRLRDQMNIEVDPVTPSL